MSTTFDSPDARSVKTHRHNLTIRSFFSSAAQVVNVLIGLAVFCTFGLQFYVCIDIAWNGLKDHVTKKKRLAEYVMRTVMTVVCVALAVAVPTIIPFVSLIGAFCFSILGIIVPILIEMLTFWDKGFGPCNWKIFKNVLVVFMGILALIFGSKSAISDIVGLYVTPSNMTVPFEDTVN